MYEAGPPMKYPYSLSAKMAQFPYKWMWANSRFLRYLGYSLIVTFPLYVTIHKAANSPPNVAKWNKIREARKHSHFDPIHE